jgi:hypothetical protein
MPATPADPVGGGTRHDTGTEAELTDEERKAIASLQRLAKRWPRSLTLASMGGQLVVVRTDSPLFQELDGSNLNRHKAVIADVHGIPNTGGDW